jgi:hypothetical protein
MNGASIFYMIIWINIKDYKSVCMVEGMNKENEDSDYDE